MPMRESTTRSTRDSICIAFRQIEIEGPDLHTLTIDGHLCKPRHICEMRAAKSTGEQAVGDDDGVLSAMCFAVPPQIVLRGEGIEGGDGRIAKLKAELRRVGVARRGDERVRGAAPLPYGQRPPPPASRNWQPFPGPRTAGLRIGATV